jgi:hypothetical protein
MRHKSYNVAGIGKNYLESLKNSIILSYIIKLLDRKIILASTIKE